MSGNGVQNDPNRPVYVPPPPPPPPPVIETPEDAIAQANSDQGSTVHGATHEDTLANLAGSRQDALDRALQEGRSGEVGTINAAFDQAQARLDAKNAEYQLKPQVPTSSADVRTPDGTVARESTYADGSRVVHTDGTDPGGNAVVTTQVFEANATGAAALVPLEGRSVVANGISTTTGLPERTVQTSPDGRGTVITDTYGSADDPSRVVQHTVLPDGQGGQQVQSVTVRVDGADAGMPPALRIREFTADGAVAFDTGEVASIATTAVPGRDGVSTVTHTYDSGDRMTYTVHAAPAGSEGIPDAMLSQSLTTADGDVIFESAGVTRSESIDADGRTRVTDIAADGRRSEYTLGDDGKVATTQVYAADGALQQSVTREAVEGLPVVASRETLTRADGSQVVTELDADGQSVGMREVAADGSTTSEVGSLKGERIDAARADEMASEILDVGDRRMWRDDYEARLMYALENMQTLDPASQQMVLTALQQQDSGMGQSWFRTGILENLDAGQMSVLEGGGLDILTGVPGTTADDLQAIKSIHELDVDAGVYTGEYGELAATEGEQQAGQLDAFMQAYQSRAADPAAQARFVALYDRMHGDAFVEGFLSDETLASARDDGLSFYNAPGRIQIDGATHDTLMGVRLETAADARPDVLAARDRVMDAGVRDFMVDNQEERVQALVTELSALDADGQAALVRQITKTDPDARLNWMRDSIIQRATEGNDAFTPEMQQLVTQVRGNGETSFMGQLQGFGGGVKDAGVGFVVGLGVLARTGYDLTLGGLADPFTGGDGPAFLPSTDRGLETGQQMIEGLPSMFSHIGTAWGEGRYGEALGNVTFDVASMFIPLKVPKIRLPGAGAADNIASGADNLGGIRYIDGQGRPVAPPPVEPRLATAGPDGAYSITDAAPPVPPRLAIDASTPRLALEAAPTAEVIAQRQATASEFYRAANGSVDPSHLNGIDFTRPVEVQTLPKGSVVYQWQAPGAPQGNYFSPSATARPTDIGISGVGVPSDVYLHTRKLLSEAEAGATPTVRNPDGTYSGMDPRYSVEVAPSGIVDKAPIAYVVKEDVDVLVSTAKPINDTWAIPDNTMASIPSEGGRLQIYTGQKDLFEPVTRGVDPPGPTPPSGLPGAYALPPGRTFADDVLGTAPHRLDGDFLQIAKHVYKADGSPLDGSFRQVAEADLPPGVTRADFEHASGLRAGLYTNGDGQFVLAFKGTAPISRTGVRDIYTDAAQGLGFPTAQYTQAVDLTQRLHAVYGDNLVLTGHSLGGGLATQASMAVGGGNLPAIVFNPAATHPRNLARENPLFRNDGAVQQAPDGGTFANGGDLAPYFAGEGGLVRAYIVRNDELTLAQDHLPGVPSAIGHREALPGNFPFGHTMGPVEKGFDKRFPDGVQEVPPDVGLWYLDPVSGQWSTRLPGLDGPG